MLTIKILFTINSLEKKKKLFIQNTIYNSSRFKKHLRIIIIIIIIIQSRKAKVRTKKGSYCQVLKKGSMKVLSGHTGQVDFLFGQEKNNLVCPLRKGLGESSGHLELN